MSRSLRHGFTLIELLVVIAIIALLIAILLPALSSARCVAQRVKSLSNVRQITTGANTYKEDFKQYMPLTLTYSPRYDPPLPKPQPASIGFCTWAYGGKNCDPWWSSGLGGGFDVEAADRPLNPYIYPEVRIDAPPVPARLPMTDPRRTSLQLDAFKDPLDRGSYQRTPANWSSPNPTAIATTSYDDVGTSYHFNVKWFDPIYAVLPFDRAFNFGCDRLRLSDAFQPSRMVWLNDQFADLAANSTYTTLKLKNTCNDINKSVMGFMDGHAAYHPVFPGGGTNTRSRSYTNEFYTFVFDDLRIPVR